MLIFPGHFPFAFTKESSYLIFIHSTISTLTVRTYYTHSKMFKLLIKKDILSRSPGQWRHLWRCWWLCRLLCAPAPQRGLFAHGPRRDQLCPYIRLWNFFGINAVFEILPSGQDQDRISGLTLHEHPVDKEMSFMQSFYLHFCVIHICVCRSPYAFWKITVCIFVTAAFPFIDSKN